MPDAEALTHFAPSRRYTAAELARQSCDLFSLATMERVLDISPLLIGVLNDCRQIVMCNDAMAAVMGAGGKSGLIGKRLGEVLGCVRLAGAPSGCGTAAGCATCGAALSILQALDGKECRQACRITCVGQGGHDSLDFQAHSAPLEIDGKRYVVITLVDMVHEQRRRALERIFFHDILNTAGGIQGLAELLTELLPEGSAAQYAAMLRAGADELVWEIQGQRELSSAERGDLVPATSMVRVLELAGRVVTRYRAHSVAQHRVLGIDPNAMEATILSDAVLLDRVLSNMVKNALEAAAPGESVTVGCREAGPEFVEIWVRNQAVMPEHIRLQVFQRSFSTKGSGRGLGTYSIKLLTERYLGGSVSFVSSESEGTEFRARYPLVLTTSAKDERSFPDALLA